MCASPGLYADTGTDPPTPFLWRDHVHMYPGAVAQITAMLDSDQRPRFVAVYQTPTACDSSGGLDRVVRRSYVQRTRIAGIDVLERRAP